MMLRTTLSELSQTDGRESLHSRSPGSSIERKMGKEDRKKKKARKESRSSPAVISTQDALEAESIEAMSQGAITTELLPSGFPRMVYQQISTTALDMLKNRTGSLLVACMALETTLALLRRGSEGATEDALAMALDMRSARDIVIDNYQALMTGKEATSASCTSSSVNILLVDDQFPLESEFARSAANGFLVRVMSQPLRGEQRAATMDKVNMIVAQLVSRDADWNPEESITQEDMNTAYPLCVVNVLFFKGRWKVPFRVECTKKERFVAGKNQVRYCDMMHVTGHFGYLSLPHFGARILLLPYADSELALLIALPNSIDGLQDLEDRLYSLSLADVLARVSHPAVEVSLPRFRLDFQVNLVRDLMCLGILCVTDEHRAQLPFISRRDGLYLGSYVQKITVQVDEDSYVNPMYPAPPQAMCATTGIYFRADHPFVFFVINMDAGWVLCAGRYT